MLLLASLFQLCPAASEANVEDTLCARFTLFLMPFSISEGGPANAICTHIPPPTFFQFEVALEGQGKVSRSEQVGTHYNLLDWNRMVVKELILSHQCYVFLQLP